jgi:hypothetical protein
MKQKLTFLAALALASLAMTAVPSAALGAGWDFDIDVGMLPLKIKKISGGETKFTGVGGGTTVICQNTAGTGEYTTFTEGKVEFTYTGCKKDAQECHSKGAAKEEVTTTTMVFHNIMIDSTVQVANGKPGILITGNNNHFATIECGFNTIEVIGNGVIAEQTSPICQTGTFTTQAIFNFSSSSTGQQTYKQVETAGTVFDLTMRLFANETASIDAKTTFEYERQIKMTCP